MRGFILDGGEAREDLFDLVRADLAVRLHDDAARVAKVKALLD